MPLVSLKINAQSFNVGGVSDMTGELTAVSRSGGYAIVYVAGFQFTQQIINDIEVDGQPVPHGTDLYAFLTQKMLEDRLRVINASAPKTTNRTVTKK